MSMKSFVRKHAILLIVTVVLLIFVLFFGIFYYTETQLKPSPLANKYGYYLQYYALMAYDTIPQLIKSGEINKQQDLIKTVGEQKFDNVKYEALIKNIEKGIEVIALHDDKLEPNSILIKQYTIDSYIYMREIDAGSNPNLISLIDNTLSINRGGYVFYEKEKRTITSHSRTLRVFSKQPRDCDYIINAFAFGCPIVAVYYN